MQRSDESIQISLRAKGNQLPRKSNPPKECQVYLWEVDHKGNLVRTPVCAKSEDPE